MKTSLKIFISSPSDLDIERQLANQVEQRLSMKCRNVLTLETVMWEREPLRADEKYQDALDPADSDIMICMLWSK